jgi:hypothetical protein
MAFKSKNTLEQLRKLIGKPIKIWILQTKEDWKDQTTLIRVSTGKKEYIVEPELYEHDYELTIYRLGCRVYNEDDFWKKREKGQEKIKKMMPNTEFNFSPLEFVEKYSTNKPIENVQIIYDFVQLSYFCNNSEMKRMISVRLHRGFVLVVGEEKIVFLTNETPFIEARKCKGEIDWVDFSFLPPYTGCPYADETKLLLVERKLISLDEALKDSVESTESRRIERYEKIIEEKFCGEIKTIVL